MINDVSALRFDPRMVAVVREGGGPVILMHMRGVPRTMQQNVDYDDLIGDIGAELREWREEAVRQGVDRDQILVDPGIGFGKTFEDNVEILANAKSFASIGPVPVEDQRLMHALPIFGGMIVVTLGLFGVVYGRLVRAKRIFDEEEVLGDESLDGGIADGSLVSL